MITEVLDGLGFVRGLRPFVREPVRMEDAVAQIEQGVARREERWLATMRDAIYGHPASPYLALLNHYRIEYQDVEALARAHGVEGALERLYDAGIHISLDEFKGKVHIERPGLHIDVSSHAFDSPVLGRALATASGGSGGVRRRQRIDGPSLHYEAAYSVVMEHALGVAEMPFAQWRPILPGSAGTKDALRQAMWGRAVSKWFSQANPRRIDPQAVLTNLIVLATRLWGAKMALPQYAPPDDPTPVAEWLAEQSAAGHPAFISMPESAAMRVCTAAADRGLSLAGTVFRLGGEPFTEARAAIIEAAGARGVTCYSMSELGRIGLPCGDPQAPDDVHLVTDKLALIQRDPGRPSTEGIQAWHLTTLLPTLPKIMLNVETGDYGAVEVRPCGCRFGALGMTTHLHTIRSYEKLTTEGMHFTASTLLNLIEAELPARYGGAPGDYQLVEQSTGGITQVLLVVSPRVGVVDERDMVATALKILGAPNAGTRMMADYWERLGTLQVVRREPYQTAAAKVQALHVLRS